MPDDIERAGEVHVGGAAVVGSDRTSVVTQLGLAIVLSPRVLLSLTLGMGVTADAPDFQGLLSVPIRFF